MKDKVLNLVYDLVDEIKSKEEYIRLLELKKIIETLANKILKIIKFLI